ncbi:RNA polymerase sigma factor [Tunicatimonas pelagia]|uniref:RNA polymerase sigma factor n=1 Tax=Tunicatimonas pelagia TaxID=931531 RepID=UPI002665F7C8|nr:sigma-70 family RNA polymerase sigma factor [Tunicatimonas pelagia]WKN43898.1 sigma-70 family RNA polymerase sigma factor [Tunicatimonas pelagia]
MPPTQQFLGFLNENTAVIRKVCRLYTDNHNDFRDYFQEVVLQLWKSFDSFRGDAKASTWVYRVALNVCLSQLKLKKRQVASTPIDADAAQHWADVTYDTTEEEQIQQLYAGIRRLKELDRAIIMLYLEERSYDEMADILGISQSNVGVRISRIKKQLNQLIHGRTTGTLA